MLHAEMDALKSAGRAIIRRPSVAKQSWIGGRHRKLLENWTDTREAVLEGMTFNLRHLGMTLVDQPKGEDLAAAAVKRIVSTAKASGRKAQKVSLGVSPRGFTLYDRSTNILIENISIHRISYCTVDKVHDRVFAFIAQNTLNGTLECHAYLCSKRKMAQAIALTVAQAFGVAFEVWQVTREDVIKVSLLDSKETLNAETNGNVDQFDNYSSSGNYNPVWETQDGLEEAFSRLAMSRTNPQVLDFGLMPQDWLCEPNWDSANGNTPRYPPWE
ncbi:low density lipoprotein receptor adapter protein 1a isoform X3 [Corythoichthys intestinalis]|uniref:low density lipoprotein receptor adapter protein 1a isoform X3 n=1 Tax=Corythoichthys intestinalis TaxID=161448 RepID=UPI0025A60030|nr:low density lipoprotein receptor adapter protein 1a isoform X3 [Corythoichthys intestinalis]